jgi:hypothetical protein
LLVVGAVAFTNSGTLAATYNGVAMKAAGPLLTATSSKFRLFFLINPASGTHDVVVSQAESSGVNGVSASYTGVDQTYTLTPDGYGSSQTTNVDPTPNYASVTTTADNCWLFGFGSNAFGNCWVHTGTTARVGNNSQIVLADSNGGNTPPGAYTLGYVQDASFSSRVAWTAMSFPPAAPVGGGSSSALFVMT